MNYKIESYIGALFADVPRTQKAQELKEELLGNMNERYEDYLRSGKSEAEAYSMTVANMGDVDAMLAAVMPDEEFRREAQRYRTRNARNTAIAVGMYILGAALVVLSSMFETDNIAILSVVGLLVIAAVATGLIIYTNMSTPQQYKNVDADERREQELLRTSAGRKFKAAMSLYWLVITVVYFAASFWSNAWHMTWLIWPLAAILSGILYTIFEMRVEK